jgi:peptidoglycan/LPS O-acetylase OafA/YrhL
LLIDSHVIEFAFWFTLGIVIGFHLDSFKCWTLRWKRFLPAALVLTYATGIAEWDMLRRLTGLPWPATTVTIMDKIFAFVLLVSFLTFTEANLPLTKPLNNLSGKSYGIFLTHIIALELIARAIYNLAPWLLAQYLVLQAVLVMAGLSIPFVLMIVVRRSPVGRYRSYFFG